MRKPTDVLTADLERGPRDEYLNKTAEVAYMVGHHWPQGLDELDAINWPDKHRDNAEDGYLDASAGRDEFHLAYCRHHGRGPGECGVA